MRFIIVLGIGNQAIGYLESWHKERNSFTVCNNKHFARYFTSEKACNTMIEKLNLSYPHIGCQIQRIL